MSLPPPEPELIRWRTKDDNPFFVQSVAHGPQRIDVCAECGAMVPWDLREVHEVFHDALAADPEEDVDEVEELND